MKAIKEIKEKILITDCKTEIVYPYTFARILVHFNEDEFVGTGFAKYNPNDKNIMDEEGNQLLPWIKERGEQIATGRAITAIAKQIYDYLEWRGAFTDRFTQ